jgi:1,4-alpha-glucan branching enzyme
MKIKSSHKPSAKPSTKKVRFKIKQPEAKSLVLVGSFTEWEAHAIPLAESEPGFWEVEVDLRSGRHEYLFVTDDGVWLQDPAAIESVANPFGGCNSVVDVALL